MLPRGAEGGGRDTHEVLCCLTRRPGAMHPRARSFDLQRVCPENAPANRTLFPPRRSTHQVRPPPSQRRRAGRARACPRGCAMPLNPARPPSAPPTRGRRAGMADCGMQRSAPDDSDTSSTPDADLQPPVPVATVPWARLIALPPHSAIGIIDLRQQMEALGKDRQRPAQLGSDARVRSAAPHR